MKTKLLVGAVVIALGAASFGLYKGYEKFRLITCKELVYKSLKSQYGEVPAEYADKVEESVDSECHQLLN